MWYMNYEEIIENLKKEHDFIMSTYIRNLSIISKAPKKPTEPYNYNMEIFKPSFKLRIIYVGLLFLILVFFSYQFPTGYIMEYFLETFEWKKSTWFLFLVLISSLIQLFYFNQEYSKYKDKLELRTRIRTTFDNQMKIYNTELKTFEENFKSLKELKIENEKIIEKIGEINSKIKFYKNKLIEVNSSKSIIETEKKYKLFCPNCGFKFENTSPSNTGKFGGGLSGATAGAILGSKVGIAMGPLGAIAGTIPGAIIGGFFGKNLGNHFDNLVCPKCETKFEIK